MFTNFLVAGDPNRQFFTETTFVLEREFGERYFLFVEFVGDYHLNGGPGYLINSGAGFRITPQQQIDFHVALGLNAKMRRPTSSASAILSASTACSDHRGSEHERRFA